MLLQFNRYDGNFHCRYAKTLKRIAVTSNSERFLTLIMRIFFTPMHVSPHIFMQSLIEDNVLQIFRKYYCHARFNFIVIYFAK